MNPSSRVMAYGMVCAAVSMALLSGCSEVSLNQPPIIDRSVPANAGPAPAETVVTPGAAAAPGGTTSGGSAPAAQPEAEPEAQPLAAPGAVQAQPLQGAMAPAAVTGGAAPAMPPPPPSAGPASAAPGMAMAAPVTPAAVAPLPSEKTPGALPAAGSWIWPVHGDVVGKFDGKTSKGIDIAVAGGENVVAVAAGTVLYAGSMQGYGRLVIVRHPGGVVSVYAHNRSNLVHEGQAVQQGDPIAIVGGGGAPSTLHFEVRRAGVPLDPMPFLGAMNAAP